MNQFEEKLERYAELAVKVGVNIQQGQSLYIASSIEVAPFTRMVVKKAYEQGAKLVFVDWSDDEIGRIKYELAPDEAFTEYPSWKIEEREQLAEQGAAFLSILSQNPDLLKGIDPVRIANFQKTAGKALNKYRQYVQSDKISWSVIAAAGQAWADKIFPDTEDSLEKLWDAIFKACRIDQEDPVEAWENHDKTLHKKVEYLNDKSYKYLHYKAPGTDLTIELSDKHQWAGAGSINAKGEPFMANMPTEEVFTVPMRNGVNGYVSSTKPLSYGGNLINHIKLTFENGRITKAEAETGEDVLLNLIDSDEGSKYLGEVALVPHQSPISDSNILFYNTLFDENASNHLAIGSGYAFCIKGGKEMNEEQLIENGVNTSIVHVDFMIGSAEMDIDGETADGEREAIFRKGNWAF